MVSRAVTSIAIAALAVSCLAEQMLTPSNGLQALDAVEQTLHKMLGARTDKALLKIAGPVVELVDKTVQEVESGNLTRKSSSDKMLFAIKAMQGLQDQLEKGSKVEKIDTTLQKELAAKKTNHAKQEVFRKKLDEMKEKLTEKKQQLDVAEKKDVTEKEQKLEEKLAEMKQMEQKLAEKKQQLDVAEKKQQLEEKLAEMKQMEEKLAEKKQELEVITKDNQDKEAAASHKKDQQENSQESSMVAGLVKMAHDLAATKDKSAPQNASKADVAKNVSKAAAAATGVAKPLQAILVNLQDQAHNVSNDLTRIDAEEKAREVKLVKLAATNVPTVGKTDAIDKGKAMIEQLAKQEQRSYKKNRALKQTQLNELNDGIRAVERGDVAALRSLMSKMQTEVKTLGSEGKGFLA